MRRNVKCVVTMLVFCIVSSAVILCASAEGLLESQYLRHTEQLTEYIDAVTKNELFKGLADCEIESIHEIYDYETREVTALLYDVTCTDGSDGYFITESEDEWGIITFQKRESYYISYLNSEYADPDALMMFSIFEPFIMTHDEHGDEIFIICRTGEEFEPVSQIEDPQNVQQSMESVPVSENSAKLTEKQAVKERMKNAERSQYSINASYPESLTISGVPNYIQENGFKCIPTSILNVIAYWDANGFPDLVPSSDNSHMDDTRDTIKSALTDAGGTGDNDNIEPAVESIIALRGYEGDAVTFKTSNNDLEFFDV